MCSFSPESISDSVMKVDKEDLTQKGSSNSALKVEKVVAVQSITSRLKMSLISSSKQTKKLLLKQRSA